MLWRPITSLKYTLVKDAIPHREPSLLSTIALFRLMIQVALLSLTNPRDALHHDKRQNFKTVM